MLLAAPLRLNTVYRLINIKRIWVGNDKVVKSKKRQASKEACRFLARRKGFEPPTFWFVAKHSIQLS